MIKKILLVALIGISFLVGVSFVIRCRLQSSVETLKAYENTIINQYTTNGILYDLSQCNELLNLIENYISQNQHKLMIRRYKRHTSSIIVEFWLGSNYLISPRVEGMK